MEEPKIEPINIIERQKSIAIAIQKKRESAVKYGAKRTRAAYQKILDQILILWKEFIDNDAKLIETAASNSDLLEQPYFVEKRKEFGEQVYRQALSFIFRHYPELNDSNIVKEPINEREEADDNVSWILDPASIDMPSSWEIQQDEAENIEENPTESALLKITEVLASQQQFQQILQEQIKQQMKALTDVNCREGLKPPRVEIPIFSGKLHLYQSFKDTFTTVTNKSKMTDLEKITLLKSKVTDLALEYISHITIADENYKKAWDILDARFDDPVAIISNCVDKILDMPPIPANDVRAFEKALNLVQGVANSLQLLKVAVNDVTLVRAVIRKLSHEASGELTRFIGNHKQFPSYEKLINFFVYYLSILRSRAGTDEIKDVERQQDKYETNEKSKQNNFKKFKKPKESGCFATTTTATDGSSPSYHCFICFEAHMAPHCDKLATSPNPLELLKHYNVCINCAGHKFNKRKPCTRKMVCDICKEGHLTALHGKLNLSPTESTNTFLCQGNEHDNNPVLLPTAVATILGINASLEKRILIDVCSQASYIEEQTLKALNLPKFPCKLSILGVGGEITGQVKWMTKFKIETVYPVKEEIEIDAFVVKTVTKQLPALPKNLHLTGNSSTPLADKFFGKPAHVPILLGANIASKIFLTGTQIIGDLLLQNTKFGWIVSGKTKSATPDYKSCLSTHVALNEFEQNNPTNNDLLENFEIELRQFWDMPVTRDDIEEEVAEVCEELYRNECKRADDGRYMVPIPWRKDAPELGNSYNIALKCFLSHEKRLEKDREHQQLSNSFMNEYAQMEHMSLVPRNNHHITNGTIYYLPYHSVLRKNAVTTKLRNVFNASAKSSNGTSLNSTIYPGPKLQTKIFNIITRIRQFRYMYSSDITKMYRQILLLPEDREKIRILYRPNSTVPIEEYCLNTVTYGIDCAPWQAIRTLHQVANDHAPSPKIAWIIKNSFYMDDLFHGADTVEECRQEIQEITTTLEKAKLPLTKWLSNNTDVLQDVNKDQRLESFVNLQVENSAVKTLGVQYYPQTDMFGFEIKPFTNIKYTKRGMLSLTASLYDPIGWILPVIMMLRILMQKLWIKNVNWDDKLDDHLKQKFENCLTSLHQLKKFQIPRWMSCCASDPVDLIGFSDASGDGIAAVVYSRVRKGNEYVITLIAAKGKVTPLKTKKNIDSKLCTIPKMELEAMSLLTDLIKDIQQSFNHTKCNVIVYTDSKVTLAWVRKREEVENKFVRRRVNKIKKTISPGMVHYVKSSENPADAASRGQTAAEFLAQQSLWTNGPDWLRSELPLTPFEEITISNATIINNDNNFINEFVEKFSSMEKLIGCLVTILLWCKTFRALSTMRKSAEQFSYARKLLIRLQQQTSFSKEITILRENKNLPKSHWMKSLCPVIDSEGILRVGGRLRRANISEEQKHPILLPKGHFATLIIRQIHYKNGHSANNLTDSILKQNYWVTGSRNIIRSEIRKCNVCLRFKAGTIQPQMSDLPADRVTPSPIFDHTAVDFCGPFNIRASRIKFEKVIKAWVAVFVCMSTKLVHLEVCLELSAENFIAAFERFTSRRSTPSQMTSDNGTNFTGTNRIFSAQFKEMLKKGANTLAIQEIKWNFIPPGSPHFGGLHEACVKTFKYFAKRMARVDILIYEEFYTLVCKIEALMNSRPMYQISTDPNDYSVLTPGHFVTQRAFKSSPSPLNIHMKSIPITKKWLQVQQLQNEIWNRFLTEYLSTQQKRVKWVQPQRNLKTDDIVILKEHLTHPLDWPLGKIIKCYPDERGIVRKVDVESKNKNIVHRATNKLIPILTEEEDKDPLPTMKTRSQKQANSFLTTLAMSLMCFLCVIGPAKTSIIEPLQPGIHIKFLEKVSLKTLNIEFNLQTDVNITDDFRIMNEQTENFKKFCEEKLPLNYINITNQCQEQYQTLIQHIKLSKSSILGYYKQNPVKRSWAAVVKIGGFLGKTSPYAFVAATAWQEYQNWQTNLKLKEVEEKFKKMSFILLNLTETENQAVHDQLNILVDQQQQLIIESEISSYVISLQSLFSSIKLRHEDLVNIRPIDELKEYLNSLNQRSSIVKGPNLANPNDIFTFYPIKRSLNGDMAVVMFQIPLVYPDDYNKYVFISIPDQNGESVKFENNQPVQQIAFNEKNSTYFFIDKSVEIFPRIFDNVKQLVIPSCSYNVLRSRQDTSLCDRTKLSKNKLRIYPVDTHSLIIFNNINKNISISCESKKENIQSSYVYVNRPDSCEIIGVPKNSTEVFMEEFTHLDNIKPSQLPYVYIHANSTPRSSQINTDELKQQLLETLSSTSSSSSGYETFTIPMVITIAASLFCIFLIVITKCFKSPSHEVDIIASQTWSISNPPQTD